MLTVRNVLLAACLLGMALSTSSARAGLLYSQPSTVGSGNLNTYTSAFLDSSNYYLTFDNFTLSSNSLVTGVSWQGDYLSYNSSTGNYTNGTSNATSWFIGIYDSNLNLLASQNVSSSSVTETLGGTFNFYNSSGAISPINYYNESTQISGGFLLNANQTYYLGIFAYDASPSPADQWSWLSGSGGDGVSYQYNTYSNSTTSRSLDRTFTLSGAVVPEPSGLVLVGLGIACLAGYSGRNRAKIASRRCSRG